jgi:hypothetical protein
MARAPKKSPRPQARPADLAERMERQRMRDIIDSGNRQDQGPSRREMESGMKAGGAVKKMAMGGKCRGMGAATRGGNFSRG